MKIAKYEIKKVRDGSFKNDEGELIPYFWIKALRLEDNVSLEFGSKSGDFEIGDEVELELEKTERAGGKVGYKHVPEE